MTLKPKSAIARVMKKLRNRKGLTQLALSGRSGVTVSHISEIENDKTRPSFEIIIKLVEIIGFPLQDFMKDFILEKDKDEK